MDAERSRRAKLNIIFSLIGQVITLVCGLVVPKALIGSFGSEAYGATTSIAQFLAYITLLEGGIGGVARAALYKPLADNNKKKIGAILNEVQRFFRIIALFFLVYVVILACIYQKISHIECLNWISTFILVIVISISIFAQYFIGITYQVLLQAAQRTFVTQIFSSIVTLLNTVCIILLISVHSNLIVVKFVSSVVFIIKPLGQYIYVRKKLKLYRSNEREECALAQKWTGLGQHIAYFLHSNTDVAVLTILSNLSHVAVYSVYNMVVSQIQNITTSFSTGMEALFGDMLAKKEHDLLNRTFDIYEAIIAFVAGILFTVTSVMLIPFVKIYTLGITDVHYIYPLFGLLLVVASYLYCMRIPYHSITIAAGHFKQTKIAAYGEAVINIILSVVMVIKFELVGVAIGTVAAVSFRTIYYVIYLSKHIFYRSIRCFIKRMLCNFLSFFVVFLFGILVLNKISITNYYEWCLCSVVVFICAFAIQVSILYFFYKPIARDVIKRILRK